MASIGSIAARRMLAEQQLTKNIQEISREMGMEVVRLPVTARQAELQHVQRMEALVDWTNKLKELLGEAVMAEEGSPIDVGDSGVVEGDGTGEKLPPIEGILPSEGDSSALLESGHIPSLLESGHIPSLSGENTARPPEGSSEMFLPPPPPQPPQVKESGSLLKPTKPTGK